MSTILTPIIASSYRLLLISRVILGLGEGLGSLLLLIIYFLIMTGLPTIYQIFAESVSPEQRSRAFSYLSAAGSIGQTVAAVVRVFI